MHRATYGPRPALTEAREEDDSVPLTHEESGLLFLKTVINVLDDAQETVQEF